MTSDETEILYARQPIYDRALQLSGYELLFRDETSGNAVPQYFDGDLATSRVLVNAFSETHVESVCGTQPVFINFTSELLSENLPFPADRLVVEVLESVEPTEDVFKTLADLRRQGYRIALDDYIGRDGAHPLLEYADIIKIDYPQFEPNEIAPAVAALRRDKPDLIVLAEKVETLDDFNCCDEAGCDLFQGYFLARPELVRGQPLPVDRVQVMELMAAINNPDEGIDDIADIIQRDAFLSMRLLKLTNSAFYYHIGEVTSLTRAILALGTIRIRAFASLLALSKLETKPQALHQIAATRGFMCQALAQDLICGPEMGFTVGLFSCLDAFFDQSLDELLTNIPFNREIVDAVLHHQGPLGTILGAVIEHEQGHLKHIRWDELALLGIDMDKFMWAFHEGVEQASVNYLGTEAVA